MNLDPTDWEYLAEGGEHAIFSFVVQSGHKTDTENDNGGRDNASRSRGYGCVLRLSKSDIRHALFSNYLRSYTEKKTSQLCKDDLITSKHCGVSQLHHHHNNPHTLDCSQRETTEDCNESIITTSNQSMKMNMDNRQSDNQYDQYSQQLYHLQMSVVKQVLDLYIDSPVARLQVNMESILELTKQAIRSGKIPSCRQKDWTIDTTKYDQEVYNTDSILSKYDCRKSKESDMIQVSLYPNYNYTKPTCSMMKNPIHHETICIEIKPKAGYLATSPLVHPLNTSKFRVSRFQILQQLHSRGLFHKGWRNNNNCNNGIGLNSDATCQLFKMSNYDPLDLFSNQKERIEVALKALFASPQNNLKVSFNNTVIYGREDLLPSHHHSVGSNLHLSSVYNQALSSIFSKTHDSCNDMETCQIELSNEIQQIFSLILSMEEFLQKLRRLQLQFDVLDVDGAIIVYDHLVKLLGGSQDKADEAIESTNIQGGSIQQAIDGLHTDSLSDDHSFQNHIARRSGAVSHFFQCYDKVTKKRSYSLSLFPDDLYASYHEQARSLVDKFSVNDCVQLLQDWLVSLMLCDISFLVTIWKETSSPSTQNITDRCIESSTTNSTYQILQMIGENSSDKDTGTIKDSNGYTYNYRIKMVDYDAKPARKLRGKMKQESSIYHFKG